MTKDCEVVVEGFPRSANTFLESMLRIGFGLEDSTRIAHHIHLPMQFEKAIKWGISTVLVVREPIDSIASLVEKSNGRYNINSALDYFLKYYDRLSRCVESVYIVDFRDLENKHLEILMSLGEELGYSLKKLPEKHEVYDFVDHLTKIRTGKDGSGYGANLDRKSVTERANRISEIKDNVATECKLDDLERAKKLYHLCLRYSINHKN